MEIFIKFTKWRLRHSKGNIVSENLLCDAILCNLISEGSVYIPNTLCTKDTKMSILDFVANCLKYKKFPILFFLGLHVRFITYFLIYLELTFVGLWILDKRLFYSITLIIVSCISIVIHILISNAYSGVWSCSTLSNRISVISDKMSLFDDYCRAKRSDDKLQKFAEIEYKYIRRLNK